MPKVSVLIPAYNVAPYINECIDSVLNQTLQDFEIICVDDCSTDTTLSILQEYAAKDDRINVIIHGMNKGQSSGRNDALEKAAGEYVYMLDADDMIVPECLEELYEICSRDGLDIAGFETKNFSEDVQFKQNVAIKTIEYQDTGILDGREALIYCMQNETFSLSTPTFMMRREYLMEKNIRFVEGILHEDVGYIFELITRARRVRFLHKVYFLRRIRANSTMTKGFTAKNIEGYIKSFYKSFELEPELSEYLKNEDQSFRNAYEKWQRDIFGRLNQLYEISAENKLRDEATDEIGHVYRIIELNHFRTDIPPIKECYLCGMGQYTERAIQAVGVRDIIIKGIIVLKKEKRSFKGFPLFTVDEIDTETPVILSVSKYSKADYTDILKKNRVENLIELEF